MTSLGPKPTPLETTVRQLHRATVTLGLRCFLPLLLCSLMAGAFHIYKVIHHLLPLRARRIPPPALLVLPFSLSGFSSSSSSFHDPYSLPDGNDTATAAAEHTAGGTDWQALHIFRMVHLEYRQWEYRQAEILEDIKSIVFLVRDIFLSGRYQDGECLTDEDEKFVVERLLAYHPNSEDKIGCGLYYDRWSIDKILIPDVSARIHPPKVSGLCIDVYSRTFQQAWASTPIKSLG